MPRQSNEEIAKEIAQRLELPIMAVRVFCCPVCGHLTFAGMLGAGSEVKVRCPFSSCVHHNKDTPWVIKTPGDPVGRMRIHRCPSPFCKHPCHIRAPWMDAENVVYANGKPVCNLAWCCGYIAPKTRIVAWCKESSCANHSNGFIIISSKGN